MVVSINRSKWMRDLWDFAAVRDPVQGCHRTSICLYSSVCEGV
jgi:hypothetical protein